MNKLQTNAALLMLLGCMGCGSVATSVASDAMSKSSVAFAQDDDPELVREALPFALKVIETFLASSPEDSDLLLAGASGFTQYTYGFLLQDAQQLEETNYQRSQKLYARCKKLFLRAREYGIRGLEAQHEGFKEALNQDPAKAAALADVDDVPLLYWTGAAWTAWIAISKDDMEAIGELRRAEALMARALALDETYEQGAIHEYYVAYEASRAGAMGGSVERAEKHRDRALEISAGKKIGVWVTWAEEVGVQTQNLALFNESLDRVLSFDIESAPENKLANVLAQRRAQWLKSRIGDLFVEDQES